MPRLSHRARANAGVALGCTAMFISLGGDGWAAKAVKRVAGKNTVTTTSIKDSTIRSKDVKNGTLAAADLSKAVQARLAAAGKAGAPGAAGAVGPAGPSGPTGPVGPAGPSTPQTIADGSITGAKIAANAITASKVADGSLGAADLSQNSVGSGELANSAVDTAALAANAVTGAKVANGSLGAADIAKASGVATLNFPNIPTGQCRGASFDTGVTTAGESVLVTTPAALNTLLHLVSARAGTGNETTALALACNNFQADIDPPAVDVPWIVFDN